MNSSLNAARRRWDLDEARTDVVDVLVVGLGATGAGAALDAASRGLSVAAVDAHDLAFGTSRWSSKLIHGGLRYLASGQVGVAWESAVERDALLRFTAPHLVSAHPYLLPLTPAVSRGQAATLMAGYRMGDALRAAARTPRHLLPGPTRLAARRTLTLAPHLRAEGLRGALLSWDGRVVDDARLVVALARTAAAHGARILTRCRALALSGDGARVRDELTGEEFDIRARAVINATGVWAGELTPSVALRPSRGTHLVLRPGALGELRVGLHVPIPGERARFALVLPQADGRIYAGLTDEPLDGPIPDVPEAPESDIKFLLDVVGTALDRPLRRSDVAGAFAGLRPLVDTADTPGGPAGASTADLSRRHAVLRSPDGVVTVVGGKLTTYRRMAEDAVDAACPHARASRTARLPLVGAGPVRPGTPDRLARRYGSEAWAVRDLMREDPDLAEPVALGITRAELVWAVRHEGALDAADLLDRRTRIGLVAEDRAAALPAAEAALAYS
ncbi:glycerol-3-phosphate dehydrogenase/oxidase [Microbispora hainanensis]|uniref:glycerol-3-phosphate dehydrogenase/oxidase n=1 Tax=Microbispora TaxID=2005 RepID=UPI00115AF2EA|nr:MULTISPECIES: glycerol-3-phosphate dehydrogenase/oxidase [Microbispora]NJP23319.1 glycerol-3-phosphate dehydrogenase/oxidase [Microbispora sp. CL1-1]TQS16389.1 glycerol-3-phosphate dehydrogenase/oxidase [Microbispora sp. SCL1-1]